MTPTTTITVTLIGVNKRDPRLDQLLNLVDLWGMEHELQSPVYLVDYGEIDE